MLKTTGATINPCGRPFFRQRSLLCLLLSVARVKLSYFDNLVLPLLGSSDHRTSFTDKFDDHLNHVFICQKSQQFPGKAMVPESVMQLTNSVISRCSPCL